MKNKTNRSNDPPAVYFGYVYVDGRYEHPNQLRGTRAVADFISTHLYAEELRICDSSDHLLLHLLDGIDISNELEEININLNEIFLQARQALIKAEDEPPPKERWEILYDQIGLSSGEIAMRQRVKKAARNACCVADVANLVQGTYFDARFYSSDDSLCWGHFDHSDLSVSIVDERRSTKRIRLNPAARVQHRSSAEDVHIFTLLDIP